ncbi:MAG: hypothetical protein U0736_27630 [Gemmataceae bacterium]
MSARKTLRSLSAAVLLAAAVTLGGPAPVRASSPDGLGLVVTPPPIHAGIGSYLSGMATRSRVIQLCAVCMAIALFIIMKKFADVGPSLPAVDRPLPPSVEDSQR